MKHSTIWFSSLPGKIRRGRFPPHLQVGPLQRKLLWRQWALTSFLSRKNPASHKLDILEAFKHIREIGIRTTRTPYIHQTVIPTPITFSWMVLFFSPAPRNFGPPHGERRFATSAFVSYWGREGHVTKRLGDRGSGGFFMVHLHVMKLSSFTNS